MSTLEETEENWRQKDIKRNKIIEQAVNVATEVIIEGSDGSVEETNYLTAEVARKLMEMALLPFASNLRYKDIFGDE
jgi:hypothetical protein